MANMKKSSLFIVMLLAALQITHAVEYNIINKAAKTPGGIRFNKKIGVIYSKQTLKSSTELIWSIFGQNSSRERQNYREVDVFIETRKGIASTINNEIHINEAYIQEYSGNVKDEITGILYHEMTHVWQWDGNGEANGGLIEGIADYVRLKAGFAPTHFVKPGQGDQWDQGYGVTARFLEYCDSMKKGFVADINKMMINKYSDEFFVKILGKTVDQLWSDYKAKYNN